MKTDIWMPIFIGDYLKDTQSLTAEEHGAYFLIMMELWVKGGEIPLRTINRIARVDKIRWDSEVWPILQDFLTINDGIVSQNRLSIELNKATSNREIARENGSKGGRPKIDKKPKNNPGVNPDHNPNHNPEETSSPSPSPSPSPKKKSKSSGPVLFFDTPYFEDKNLWCEKLEPWAREEALKYWDSAVNYSNKGNKAINWILSVRGWQRRASQPEVPQKDVKALALEQQELKRRLEQERRNKELDAQRAEEDKTESTLSLTEQMKQAAMRG